jgi:hypothetical protein
LGGVLLRGRHPGRDRAGAAPAHGGSAPGERRKPPAFVNTDEPIIIVKRVRELLDTDRVLMKEYSDGSHKGAASYIVAVEPKNLLALEEGLRAQGDSH